METVFAWTLTLAIVQALPPTAMPVDTGGARLIVEGLRGGPVTGAVGPTQYVQVAGGMMAIYDKRSGQALRPPTAVGALYALAAREPGTRACAVRSDAPAALMYDHLGERWLIAYRASAGRYLCLAVSANGNAAGSYQTHALPLHRSDLGPPAMALWPGAIMFSFNLPLHGSRVCAIGRQTLHTPYPALQCRDIAQAAVVPASVAPQARLASDTPALLLALDPGGRALSLWRYAPSRNLLHGPLDIPVAPFVPACAGHGSCIVQPAGGSALPAHAARIAPGALYDGKALLLNHTVALADGAIGVRWYEIHAPFGAAQVYQQGTYAPDPAQRWMASIGIDRAGNIALGYGVSSPDTAPGIRYTGRLRTDPPGRMQREETIVNGSGVQATPLGLALPGGALALDPVDGCTFWYTQQYIQTSSAAAWQSRIASFKFRQCE